MLSHHLEFTVIPQADMVTPEALALILQWLHPQLPNYQGEVGIAFPGYIRNRSLGSRLRLFASEQTLARIRQSGIEEGINDYALIGKIKEIPAGVKEHVCYTRQRQKGLSDLRRAKKRLATQGLSNEEVERRLANKARKALAKPAPYLYLQSQSTGQRMTLAIERKTQSEACAGQFGSYGLSNQTTVPDF